MIKRIKCVVIFIVIVFVCASAFSQSKAISSAILNFGSNTCGNNTNVEFTLIGKPTTAPYAMANCIINPPFNNVFSRFIAYNPKDNAVYINDIQSNDSRLYIYNMGLPLDYSCPAVMPMSPNYLYSYVPNNFEFDINGDVWSIRSLSGNDAIIERIDEATGTILFTKTLNFPAGNVPNTLFSGDIVIIPNGRMYLAMGDIPCKFFEVTNYATAIGNATANFIQDMPRPCYGILYLNGAIQLCGTDFGSSCYRYNYDIPSHVMGPELPFQLGLTPVDNSSISPSVGISERLIGSTNVNASTEDIVYEIYAKNLGNVKLANFNILGDMAAVFGAGNVSAASATIIAGTNPYNLVLNPAYDGITDTKIFLDNQVLTNMVNGYVSIEIRLRATNLISNKIYNSTTFALGEIGKLGLRIPVIYSSNNGTVSALDPNNDGDAGDINENKPTPYYFGVILPVKFIDIKAARINKDLHNIKWTIATPAIPLSKFEVEYSEDNAAWKIAGTVAADENKNTYHLNYTAYSTNTFYYRVRTYETSGKNYLSTVVMVNKIVEGENIKVSPNPADGLINVYSSEEIFSDNRRVYMIDVSGKKVYDQPFLKQNMDINTSTLPNGYYVVNIADRGKIASTQVLIKHK